MNARVLSFVLAAAASWPNQSSAYCRGTTTPWSGAVRVQLHDLLDDNLRHADGTLWTRVELEHTVRVLLENLNESAAADIPYVYLDTTAPDPTCTVDTNCADGVQPWTACYTSNTVVVLPDCLPTQLTAVGGDPTTSNSHIIHLARSLAPPALGTRWTHGAWYAGADDFEMALLHELGHSLGLGHVTNDGFPWAQVCVPNTTNPVNSACPMAPFQGCPIMASDRGWGFSSMTFGFDDATGLRGLHGLRPISTSRNFEDGDLTVHNFVSLPMTGLWGISYYGASSSPAALDTDLTMVGYLRSSSGAGRWIMSGWTWADGSMSVVSTPPASLPATGPLAAAETPTSRVVAGHAFRNSGDARHYRRRISADFTTTPTVSWTNAMTNPPIGAIDDVYTPGVSAAFDPQSGAVIFATRSDTGYVVLTGRSGGSWSQPVQTAQFSYAQPGIACSSTRCMFTHVRAMRPLTSATTPTIGFQEFTWTQVGNVATYTSGLGANAGWSSYGFPSASVVARAGGGFDFLVVQTIDTDLTGGVFGSYTWAYRHTEGTLVMDPLSWITTTPWEHAASTAGGNLNYAEAFVNNSP